MKHFYRGCWGCLVLLLFCATANAVDSVAPVAVVSGPVSLDTGATPTATPIPGTSNTGVSVACIDDSGNSTSPANTCSAILPKCSDLKATYEKTVKTFLSWKIYGYYQGKNVDLDSSTLTVSAPVLNGTALLYPICSIVGHTMQFTGTSPLKSYDTCDKPRAKLQAAYAAAGIEYANQTIVNKTSCGARPNITINGKTFTMGFQNNAGNQWNSWMVGAYPWLIRRYAYEVLNSIKPDLSNLNDVISDTSVKADMSNLNSKMSSYYTALSSDSKAVCTSAGSNLVTNCATGKVSLTDPSNKICTLVKAQTALNNGGMPNIIVKEIMKRVQTNYDLLFTKLINFTTPTSQNLWYRCRDTGGLFKSVTKKNSQSASCLIDGAEFYTSGDGQTTENGCTGSAGRRGTFPVSIEISDGSAQGSIDGNGAVPGWGPDKTLTMGFAAVVESIIRRDICQQKSYTDASICDSVAIPDKPDGVQ